MSRSVYPVDGDSLSHKRLLSVAKNRGRSEDNNLKIMAMKEVSSLGGRQKRFIDIPDSPPRTVR